VFSASSIAEARVVLDDPSRPVQMVIADHRLPDGLGIQFVIEIKEAFPSCKCAVVSGCLSQKNIDNLEANQIPYYRKPLLYAHVVDDLRRIHAERAKTKTSFRPGSPIENVETAEPKTSELEPGESKTSKSEGKGFKLWPFK
jgi:DNA-binding NtrC family response regulator